MKWNYETISNFFFINYKKIYLISFTSHANYNSVDVVFSLKHPTCPRWSSEVHACCLVPRLLHRQWQRLNIMSHTQTSSPHAIYFELVRDWTVTLHTCLITVNVCRCRFTQPLTMSSLRDLSSFYFICI